MRIGIAAIVCLGIWAQAAVADVKRHKSFPEPLQGKWAPTADACSGPEASLILLSADKVGNCLVDSVAETPSDRGPKYSALLRCPKEGDSKAMTEAELIVWPKGKDQFSAGPSFNQLKDYQRCPAN